MNEQEALIIGILKLQSLINVARKKIKLNQMFGTDHYNSKLKEDIKMYEIAIDALEKQIPMEVEIKKWSPAVCPSCGYELSTHHGDGYYTHPTFLERCPNPDCGQRLKWGE